MNMREFRGFRYSKNIWKFKKNSVFNISIFPSLKGQNLNYVL